MDLNLLSWNVRGMVNRDKRAVIKRGISNLTPDILCVQESKMQALSDGVVKEVWGLRPCKWLALPSLGASGGILLVWDVDKTEVLDHEIGAYSIAIRCRLRLSMMEWIFVGVYSPVLVSEIDIFWMNLTI